MADLLVTPIDPLGTGRTPSSSRGEPARVLSSLEPGDVFNAQIVSRLPGGIYKVVIAGQQMRMALPDYLTPGQTVQLRVVANEPQLTFAMKEAAPSLSSAARLLSSLAPQSGALPAAALASTAASPPANTAQISAGLQQSLTQSGLFYESHLAQWLAGNRNLSQVLQEPQARILLPAQASGASSTAASTASTSPQLPGSPGNAALPLESQALALVPYQLAALDSSSVLLQLEVWPGQWLRWQVEELHEHKREPGNAEGQDSPPAWRTRLDLELPQLGTLSAGLMLGPDGLDMQINAADSASAELLQGNRLALQQALAEAGVPASSIAIRHRVPD